MVILANQEVMEDLVGVVEPEMMVELVVMDILMVKLGGLEVVRIRLEEVVVVLKMLVPAPQTLRRVPMEETGLVIDWFLRTLSQLLEPELLTEIQLELPEIMVEAEVEEAGDLARLVELVGTVEEQDQAEVEAHMVVLVVLVVMVELETYMYFPLFLPTLECPVVKVEGVEAEVVKVVVVLVLLVQEVVAFLLL